jgi:hypothetical protein
MSTNTEIFLQIAARTQKTIGADLGSFVGRLSEGEPDIPCRRPMIELQMQKVLGPFYPACRDQEPAVAEQSRHR